CRCRRSMLSGAEAPSPPRGGGGAAAPLSTAARFTSCNYGSPTPRFTLARMKRIVLLLFVTLALHAQETPLTTLPYTPSLDVPSMDKSVNPCVDFYQYSCGGWMAHNPIPADQATWSVYGKLTNENLRFLWGILDEASKPYAHRTAVQRQIGDYFAACMNEPEIETLGIKPLEPLLSRIAALKSKKDLP